MDEALQPSIAKPSFEVRMMPDEPTLIPVSVFVFGNRWVGAFLDDDKTNFTFVIFNKATLASKSQDYFLPRWQMARPLPALEKPSRKNRGRKARKD